MSARRRNRPLRCRVSQGVLTIEIGIDVLAFSALAMPYVWDMMGDHGKTRPDTRFHIDDKLDFAHDVASAINDEAEDGSSLLTSLFDAASQKAIEEGSIAFLDSNEDES